MSMTRKTNDITSKRTKGKDKLRKRKEKYGKYTNKHIRKIENILNKKLICFFFFISFI